MIDQEKIILMTKLAISDKKHSKKDAKITGYYREDYVYINNFKTRLLVFLCIGACIALELLLKIEKGITIPDTHRGIFTEYVLPYGGFLVGVLIVYTIISTIIYAKKYNAAEKRVYEYEKVLKQLAQHEENKHM